MNALTISLLLCLLLGVIAGFKVTDQTDDDYSIDYSEDDDSDLQAEYKRAAYSRTSNHCIPWRSPCTQDDDLVNKYKFLRCCNRGACRCNFWGNNCRCEATLGR